ncbi:MAG: PAS domain S-box protein [Acidobacteriota bacterium]|nr:PAS domain S-box protein [Acidobacteriota bacterium]
MRKAKKTPPRDVSSHLKATEEQLQLTQFSLDHASDPVFWMDSQGRILYANDAACRSMGRSKEELLSLSILDINPTVSTEIWTALWEKVKVQGSRTFETCHRTKEGKIFPVEVTSNYLQIGGKEYAFAFARDITERKQGAEALQREKAFTEAVIDSFPDVFFVIQETGEFLHWGRNPERFLGYTQEETLAMESAVAIVAEEDRALAARKIQEAFAQGSTSLEVRLLHRDGRKIPYLVRATRAVIGQETYIVGFGLDISERKRAGEARQESEMRFQTLIEKAPLAIGIGRNGLNIYANPKYLEMFGLENLGEFVGRSIAEQWSPESWQIIEEHARRRARGLAAPETYEAVGQRRDGSHFSAQIHITLVNLPDGPASLAFITDIGERKQAAEKIKTSEEKFRKAFMTGADAFYIATLNEGRLIEVNDRFQDVFGYSHEEMAGKTTLELGLYANPDDRQTMISEIKSKGFVRNMEVRSKKKDGTLITALVSINRLQGGIEQLVLGVVRDITEQKQAQEALRQSAVRLKEAEYLAHLGSSSWDVATNTTAWSDEMYRIAGRDPRLPPPGHQERAAIYAPESWERLEGCVQRALATGEPYDLEVEVVRPDGTRRHAHARGAAQRGPDGRVIRLYGTLQDITERKEAEKAAREAESEYRKIFEGAIEGIYRTSLEGKSLRANPALAQMLGYDSADEFISATNDTAHQVWLDSRDRSRYVALTQEYGTVLSFECQLKRKDGTAIWVSLNSRLVRDVDGRALYFEGFIEDITERKQAEEVLRKSEAELKEAQRLARLGSWLMDVKTGQTMWSNEVYRMLGLDPSLPSPPSQEHSRLFTPESWTLLAAAVDKAAHAGVAYELELETVRADGSRGWMMDRGEPVCDAEGAITHLRGVAMDITQRRNLEEQFRQAQKMEAVGSLAGGVAHDFNNLLTIINGYSDILLESQASGHTAISYLKEIKDAGNRAASLTRQLLAFSRRQVLAPQVLNLNVVIANLGKMVARLIGEDIKLHTIFDPSLARVRADPGQIEQVIMNLVVNARDAMPSGGNLTIETSNVELDENYAQTHPTVKPGPHVMFAVADTGTGITLETQARIFEPFFTTKEQGKGTGLGLATVYGIVKQSGGSIWVYSELGHGTVFKIYLPAVSESLAEKGHAKPEMGTALGSETILVVEDEEGVRSLVREALESRGYKVLETDDAEKALTLCTDHAGTIDLLLTDVVMPKMSGPAVAGKVTALRPGIKVLYMSGYTDEAIVHHGVLGEGIPFIQKPFSPLALRKKIREVLGGK